MALSDVLLCFSGALLTATTLWRAVSLNKNLQSFSRRLRQDADCLLELRHRKEAYRRLLSAQQVTESVFDISAVNMRRMHMGLADVSFGFLESIPKISKAAKIIRKTHDLVTETAHRSILGVNRVAGRFARKAIEHRWDGHDSTRESH